MDVRWVSVGIGLLGGALALLGINSGDEIGSAIKNLTIGAKSSDASFLEGDWCESSGRRHRYERNNNRMTLSTCSPQPGIECDGASLDGVGGQPIDLGWEGGTLTYKVDGEFAKTFVTRVDPQRFQARIGQSGAVTEWVACAQESLLPEVPKDLVIGMAVAEVFEVEPFTPNRPLYVGVENARFRSEPHTGSGAIVLKIGKVGEPVTVDGRIQRRDGYWYRASIMGGTPAFIRMDLLTDVLPEPEPEPEPAPVAAPAPLEGSGPAESAPAVAPPPKPNIVQRPAVGPRFTKPPYPPTALRARQEGETELMLCVDARGGVTDVRLHRSAGFAALDEAAISHVRGQQMRAAKDASGQTVEFCGWRLTIQWSLDGAH
jgi:TonB family protein